jgi:hypothetical protein
MSAAEADVLPTPLCPDGSPQSLPQVSSEESLPGTSPLDTLSHADALPPPTPTDGVSLPPDDDPPDTSKASGGEA